MADNGSESMFCSASNPVDNANNEDNFPDEFPIEHWNLDPEGDDEEEANGLNIGVFRQDNVVSYMDNTVCLEFPKFSKGFKASDFTEFVRKYVGEENLEKLDNYKHPNVWMMQVKKKEIRENLLRLWKTKIKNKTCWINPCNDYELRGFLHWVPHFVSDDAVKIQLSQFGDVLFLKNEVHDYWNGEIKSDVRYFGLRLKDGMVKNDLPHFLKFEGYRTLVIVRGRQPACFHCREFGHSKRDCKKYKEKLDEYCKNPEARKPRTKPRGRSHRPDCDYKEHQDETNTNSTSIILTQKDAKHVKSCLKRTCSSKKKEEILVILRSLKEWKEGTIESVEQTLSNIEKKLRMYSISPEITETEEKSSVFPIETIIEISADDMKQITINMMEQTLNNLKNIVAEHFELDSNEPLEKLISNFETIQKEKSGSKEVKFIEEENISFIY